jgi:lipopolysaccharide/colanic/teichoic acid biosynthesis glycosyltransferase
MTTANIAVPKLRAFPNSFIKRGIDLAGSSVMLLIFAPAFVFVAALIKLDSDGPALFRQKRIGKDGKPFDIWKFRSMRVDAHPYARSPAGDHDPRLTRIGRVLRRFSIDELPQLVNVLKGEMSLVGPRPEMPYIVEKYGPLERERLCVRPGITGLWQISPARAMPIHENLNYDFTYIENQCIALDCIILLRTITAVIRGIGAA